MNLTEIFAGYLGYDALQKVDPNTQDTHDGGVGHGPLPKAVIPAVLAAFFNKATGPDLDNLINSDKGKNWPELLFGSNQHAIVQRITDYTGSGEVEVENQISKTAEGFINWFRTQPGEHKAADMRRILDASKQNISSYLPASLHIGDSFNKSTLDDQSNKMEGPVSGLMHKIENLFSSNEQPEQKPASTDQ